MEKTTKERNKGAIIWLVIMLIFAWFMYQGNVNTPSQSEVIVNSTKERFEDILSVSPEVDSIEYKNESYVIFKYRYVPEDLEFNIRANTVTFSNFRLANSNSSNGFVNVEAQYDGKIIFSCIGSKGRVESCRKY